MNSKHVLTLGDVNVDMVIRLPERVPGQMPQLTPPTLFGGGSVGNVAVALARLDVPVAFVGTVGDDGFGRFALDDLAGEGVDTTYLQQVHAFTTTVFALIEPDGERLVTAWPPENAAHTFLSPQDVEAIDFSRAAWLHTSGMVMRASPVREAALHAMALARQAGVPVSLDLNLRLELWGWGDDIRATITQAVALADVVFGSAAEEIAPLAGADDHAAAAQALADRARTVIARLGAEGALIVTPDGRAAHVAGFPTPVVDTLGAGDAFDGGFIAARLAGRDAVEAARWGNATAAWKIAHHGARGLPRREDVARVLSVGRVE